MCFNLVTATLVCAMYLCNNMYCIHISLTVATDEEQGCTTDRVLCERSDMVEDRYLHGPVHLAL